MTSKNKNLLYKLKQKGNLQESCWGAGETGMLEDQVWKKTKEGNQATNSAEVMPQDSLVEALLPMTVPRCPGTLAVASSLLETGLLHCHRGYGAP